MCLIRGGLLPLVLGGILVLLSLLSVEASLMGKGLGIGALSGQSRRPWDRITHGRPWGKSRHPYDHAEPEEKYSYHKPTMYEMYGDPSPRNRPCVGACYYEKLRGLKSKTDAEQIPNETVQEEAVYEEPTPKFEPPPPPQPMLVPAAGKTIKKQPCVGICQYYRSLGLENPYEKRGKLMV